MLLVPPVDITPFVLTIVDDRVAVFKAPLRIGAAIFGATEAP